MNEQEATERGRDWLEAVHLRSLFQGLDTIQSDDRRLMCFVWLCLDRISHLLRDPRSQRAVELVHRIAQGQNVESELAAIRKNAKEAHRQAAAAYQAGLGNAVDSNATFAAYKAIGYSEDSNWGSRLEQFYFDAALQSSRSAAHAIADTVPNEWAAANAAETARQADFIRCLFDNPFRPSTAPPGWPETVVQLAQSLYDGQDCAFALHDALLDAGLVQFADHFKPETGHPKGCWLLDLILGKT